MLRLSDFVTCRKNSIIRVGGLYLSFKTPFKDEIQNIPLSDSNKQIDL